MCHLSVKGEFMKTSILESGDLELYLKKDFFLFPVYEIENNRCTCGKSDCKSPGKHPRTKNGHKDASNDFEKIREWWTKFPNANVGIVTGKKSNLVVMDVDPRNGGDDSFKEIEKTLGPMPETVEVLTGGDGRHLLFDYPSNVTIRSKNGWKPGIDIKADGGFIVAPPSIHISGKSYFFENDHHLNDVEIASLPHNLVNAVMSHEEVCRFPSSSTRTSSTGIPIGARNSSLFSLGCSMRNKGANPESVLAALFALNDKQNENAKISKIELEKITQNVFKYPSSTIILNNSYDPKTTWPKPLGEKATYGLAGEVVRLIEPASEADPAALLFQFLTAFGNLVGKNFYCEIERDIHPGRLFCCLVGNTSKGRKGTSWRQIKFLLSEVDENWRKICIKDGVSSGEGVIWSVRDPIISIHHIKDKKTNRIVENQEYESDPGVLDKRLLICEGEFAQILKVMQRDGNNLSVVIRNSWDTGDLHVTNKNSPAKSTGAHISIIGHITKQELLRNLNSTEAANGFGNRFLWIVTQRSKLLPEGGTIDLEKAQIIIESLRKIADFSKSKYVANFDSEARKMWHSWYYENAKSNDTPNLFGFLTARREAQIRRIALIYALLDCSHLITSVHLEAALECWRYCEESCQFIFGDATGNPIADHILSALRKSEYGLTRTEIHSLFSNNGSAGKLELALNELIQANHVYSITEKTDGRQAERWFACTNETNLTKIPSQVIS